MIQRVAGWCLRSVGHLLLALLSCVALAQTVVVEGQAPIANGDIGLARQDAMRRALSMAANSGSVQINAQTTSEPGALQDSVRLNATACTKDATVLAEEQRGNDLVLTVAVTLSEGADCPSQCRANYSARQRSHQHQ